MARARVDQDLNMEKKTCRGRGLVCVGTMHSRWAGRWGRVGQVEAGGGAWLCGE
jgi:hypothetical protein